MMEYKRKGTVVENVEPLAKIAVVLVLMTLAIYNRNFWFLTVLLGFGVMTFLLARLSFREFSREIRVFFAFFVILVFYQAATISGEILWSWWILEFSLQGLLKGLVSAYFIFDVLLLVSVFIQTTDPSRLVQSLVRLRVPYEFAFLFGLTMRFVGILQRELLEVKVAQACRGHRLRRPWDFFPLLLPILHKSFQRAQEIAISLEARGFAIGKD